MDQVKNDEASEKARKELEIAFEARRHDDQNRQGRLIVVRTLPIRVAPILGEALDSWLEAIAHRTHTAFGDVLSAVGLARTRYDGVGTNALGCATEPRSGSSDQ